MMELLHTAYEEKGSVAIIKLCNPDKMNALTNEMIADLFAITDKIRSSDHVRAAVVTGEGRAFCAGGDLEELETCYGGPVGFARHMDGVSRMIAALAELPIPVIAAVNGAAVGAGMNIALACDMIIAAENAKFSEIFTNIGLVPDLGGTFFLPRLIGMQKAKELIFTAKTLLAQEAYELGFVNQVVAKEALLDTALAMAERFANGPTNAYALAKKMVNKSFEMDLKTALDYEGMMQSISGSSEDFKEGLAAFKEKRKPAYKGK